MTVSEPTGLEHLEPLKIKATSATERAVFRKCRRQWWLTVAKRLGSREGNSNFWLGTLVHKGLEGYYRTLLIGQAGGFDQPACHRDAAEHGLDEYQRAYDASLVGLREMLGWLWPNYEGEYRDLGQLGLDMLSNYFEHEETHPLFDEVVAVEERLFVPILDRRGRRLGVLAVQTDVVGKRGGRYAVADHKTASREASSAQLDLDDQLTAEVWAVWRASGVFPEEAVYNALLKKAPHPPKTLKAAAKGGAAKLSQDKTQVTTYGLYVAEIRRLGLNLSDYSEMLLFLKDQEQAGESQLFRREGTFRTPGQMRSFEDNLLEEFTDMRAVGRDPRKAYPNPSPFNCPSCSVKAVCLTMMDGGDAGSVIQNGYVVLEPRY